MWRYYTISDGLKPLVILSKIFGFSLSDLKMKTKPNIWLMSVWFFVTILLFLIVLYFGFAELDDIKETGFNSYYQYTEYLMLVVHFIFSFIGFYYIGYKYNHLILFIINEISKVDTIFNKYQINYAYFQILILIYFILHVLDFYATYLNFFPIRIYMELLFLYVFLLISKSIHLIVIVLFCILLLIIRDKFKLINLALTANHLDMKEFISLCAIHEKFIFFSKRLNELYFMLIFLSLLLSFAGAFLASFIFYVSFVKYNTGQPAPHILWVIIQIIQTNLLAIVPVLLCDEANKTVSIIHDIRPDNKIFQNHIILTSLQMYHNQLKFTVCKIFNLDLTVIGSIFSGVATLTVFVIQVTE